MADIRIRISARDTSGGALRGARSRLEKIAKSGAKASQSLSLGAGLNQAGAALSRFGQQGRRGIGDVVTAFRGFEQGIANVKTLSGAASSSQKQLAIDARAAALEFGADATAEAAAQYQIYSKFATDAATANKVLAASNQLAVAGQTDVLTATDGLTSVLNAYGLEITDVAAVSNSFFAAQDKGALTIGQLSSNIGKVAGLANAAGVGFEDMNAAIATITKSGKNADVAATGLRGVFAAILKPSRQVRKTAKRFGVDFSVAGLKAAGGLEGFVKVLDEATNRRGKKLDLAKLGLDVRAFSALLDLGSNSGKTFRESLEGQADAANIAGNALKVATDTKAFKLKKLESEFADLKLELGEEFLPLVIDLARELGPTVKSIAELIKENPKLTIGLVAVSTALGPLLQGAGSATLVLGGLGVTAGDTAGALLKMKGPISQVAGTPGGKLGIFGLVVAAGAAGFAFGTFIDDTLDLSGTIAKLAGEISGLNTEMDRLNDRKVATNQREQIANLEQEAKDARARVEELSSPGTTEALIGGAGIALAGVTFGASLGLAGVAGVAQGEARETELKEAQLQLARAQSGITRLKAGPTEPISIARERGLTAEQKSDAIISNLQVRVKVDQDGRVSAVSTDSDDTAVESAVEGGGMLGG